MVFNSDNRSGVWAVAALAAVALVLPQSAGAWAWPVSGPVLKPFHVDEDPYEAGQHRGIEIGALQSENVLAPVTAVVAFAGTVPNKGRALTLRTENGYSVTLLHLGPLAVRSGTWVEEGDVLAAVEPDVPAGPFVYLGVRLTAEPHGYVDPLSLLPARGGRAPDPAPEPGSAPPAQPTPAQRPAQPAERVPAALTPARTSAAARAAVGTRSGSRPVATVGKPSSRRVDAKERRHRARVPRSSQPRAVRVKAPTPAASRTVPAPKPSVGASPHVRSGETRPGSQAVRHGRVAATHQDRRGLWLYGLALLGFGLCTVGVAARRRSVALRARPPVDENALRKMSQTPRAPEESPEQPEPPADSRRRRVAVCERPATHRPCRGVRRPFGHVRALSPAQGQSRPHDQRDGRARDAGDGHRRPRGNVAA